MWIYNWGYLAMFKYFINESIKKLVQMIFGLEIFDFSLLNSLRKLAYRMVFKIGDNPIIEKMWKYIGFIKCYNEI